MVSTDVKPIRTPSRAFAVLLAGLTTAAVAAETPSAEERTIAEWRFDELAAGASDAGDSSENGHRVTLHGRWNVTDGQAGTALRLSGGGWAEGPTVASLGILSQTTADSLLDGQARGVDRESPARGMVLEAVIRPRQLTGEQVVVGSYEEEGDQRAFRLSLREDRAVFTFSVDGRFRTSLDSGLQSDLRLVAGEWNRIRVIFDGRFVSMQINGEDDPARAYAPGIHPADRPLQIGRGYDGKQAAAAFDGDIDLVRLATIDSQPADEARPAPFPAGMRNNLVTDLLEKHHPQAGDHAFELPSAGWVFFELEGLDADRADAVITLGTGQVVTLSAAGRRQAMTRLPQGAHRARLDLPDGATPTRLIVRRVPELGYIRYGYGRQDWSYLSEHVLRYANVCVSGALPVKASTGSTTWFRPDGVKAELPPLASQSAIDAWAASGREWIIERPSGYWGGEEGWSKQFDRVKDAFVAPLSGVLVDEFGFYYSQRAYDVWADGIARLHREFPGPRYFAYMFGLERFPSNHSFVNQLLDSDDRIVWELYIREEPNEDAARAAIDQKVIQPMRIASQVFPDLAGKVIFCPSLWTGTGDFTDDFFPEVDQKVFLDMQFQAVATDPELRGFGGYAPWTSGYSSDEMLRWVGALYEHYGIRGETEPLSNRHGYRYALDHLDSYGFENEAALTLLPAGEGSLKMQANADLPSPLVIDSSRVQPLGDWSVVMQRSTAAPNVVRQSVKNLEPGKLYSITVHLIDLDAPDQRPETFLPLGIELAAGTCLPEFDEQSVIYSSRKPGVVFVTRLMRVFRAEAANDQLSLADWVGGALPAGREGQTFLIDNIAVQPFFADGLIVKD